MGIQHARWVTSGVMLTGSTYNADSVEVATFLLSHARQVVASFRRTHLSLIIGMLIARSVCSDAGRTESMLSVASVAIFRLLGFLVQRGLSRLRQQHALLRMSQEPHTIGNLA